MRAMSRRTWRTRAVFASWPPAFWKRRLNASLRRLPSSSLSWSWVRARRSLAFMAVSSGADTRHEARLDGQLRGGKVERLARHIDRDALELEQHAARLDTGHPELGCALAGAHADFGRLLRHRHVGKHANPDATGALHMARDGAASRLYLARGEAIGLHRLQ